MSGFLAKLETYTDLEGSIIRATKINKVLKAMLRLSSIPKDDEYQFKKRSHDLLANWNSILSQDSSAGADDKDGDDARKSDEPATNGISKEPKAVKPAAAEKNVETDEAKKPESSDAKTGVSEDDKDKVDDAPDQDENEEAETTTKAPKQSKKLNINEPEPAVNAPAKLSDHPAEAIEATS